MSIAKKLLLIAKNEPRVLEAGKVGPEKTVTLPEIGANNPLRELLQTLAENTLRVYNAGRGLADRIFKTVSGAVIRADDVSETEHNLNVTLTSDTVTDFSGVNVSKYGKNLLPDTIKDFNNWTSQSGSQKIFIFENLTVGEKYTFSFGVKNSLNNHGYFYLQKKDEAGTASNIYRYAVGGQLTYAPQTFTVESGYTYYLYGWFQYADSGAFETITNMQLEVGSVQTDYEAYIEPQTVTANADGRVYGLTSASPTMTLLTDTENVTINCEYLQKEGGD